MLSQTGVYALQAALYLAAHQDRPVPASAMAEAMRLPANYLSKVLQRLSREGMVRGTRGPRGGYVLGLPPRDITVAQVVAPFEDQPPADVCLLGGSCDPDDPCTAHHRRELWRRAYQRQLRETTLADLLEAPAGEGLDGLTALPMNEEQS